MTLPGQEYDVMIIGGGPAGMSAMLWCAELDLTALLIERNVELGGQLLRIYAPIANYLGLGHIEPRHLCDLFVARVRETGGELMTGANTTVLDLAAKTAITTDGTSYRGKAFILATGVRRRRLGIPGEEEFAGRGVLESGARSKEEVTGKTCVIVGGGDAAIENALILSERAKSVIVVHRRKEFTARDEFLARAMRSPNIRFLMGQTLTSIKGEGTVQFAEISDPATGELSRISADNVLIRIGTIPNTEMLKGQIHLNHDGYIRMSADCETSVPGVFAAGDVANRTAPTISAAVGQGAVAARAAFEYITRLRS